MNAHTIVQIGQPQDQAADAPFPVPVEGDGNEPTLKRGDVVIVVPVKTYQGDGFYAFRGLYGPRHPGVYIYRAEASCNIRRPHIRMWHDNKLYGTFKKPMEFSWEDFNRYLIGKVAAHVHIIDPHLIPRLF